MRIVDSRVIAATPERVWALTVDVERWPEITPTMREVRLTGSEELAVGSLASVRQPGQPARTWTVTRLEAPACFEWQTEALGTTMTARHDLSPEGDGTRNTLTVEIEGRWSALVGPLLRRPIARAIAQENAGFATTAEARAG